MGETLAGLENIAKHFHVSLKTVQTWLSIGMPFEIDGKIVSVSVGEAEEWVEKYRNYANLFDGDYQVQIVKDGKVLWAHGMENGCRCGLNNTTYYEDDTFIQICGALQHALDQAQFDAELASNL